MLGLGIKIPMDMTCNGNLSTSPITSPKSSNHSIAYKQIFSPNSPTKRKRVELRESFAERSQTLARQKHIAHVSRDDKDHVIVRGNSFGANLNKSRPTSAPGILSPGKPLVFSPKPSLLQENAIKVDNQVFTSPIPKRIAGKSYLYLTARGVVAELSPRSKYINACFREHLNPRQLLVAKVNPLEINLQHQVII